MIKFNKINLAFNNKVVFQQLDLHIAEGDKIAILGKSGLGKSSLFGLILGFITPQAGNVLFNNDRVNEKNVWDIRKNIAFVDQEVSIGEGKVIDRLQAIFDFKANCLKGFLREEIEQLFEYFDLDIEDLNKSIEDLSGGERQRLAVIVSILLKRKIFLFDEITSALDAQLKEKVVDYFTRKKEWTVIVISHDAVWLNHPEMKVFDLKEKRWKQ